MTSIKIPSYGAAVGGFINKVMEEEEEEEDFLDLPPKDWDELTSRKSVAPPIAGRRRSSLMPKDNNAQLVFNARIDPNLLVGWGKETISGAYCRQKGIYKSR